MEGSSETNSSKSYPPPSIHMDLCSSMLKACCLDFVVKHFFAPLHSSCWWPASYHLPFNILDCLLPKPGLESQSIPVEYQMCTHFTMIYADSLINTHFVTIHVTDGSDFVWGDIVNLELRGEVLPTNYKILLNATLLPMPRSMKFAFFSGSRH